MNEQTVHTVGIIMNGVTGRMGLQPAPAALDSTPSCSRAASQLSDSEVIMPKPLLVGRNAAKLEAICERVRRPALDHRSRQGARRSAVLRSTSTRRPPTAAPTP